MSDPGFRITSLWAWTQVGDDDEEGIIGFLDVAAGWWIPMIASDHVRLDEMRPRAQHMATLTGKPVTLSRYEVRVDLEDLQP